MVVSKYIGETEKNLASLFERAEHKNWILFFDEADAIFGKRTGVRDAHDKYANQEVSYLLQRIESHSGLSILASNFKNNIDQAFIRRFNSMIYFPNPGYEEKCRLWQNAFPKEAPLATDISFEHLSSQYELTGAQIMNVVQYTCLQSLASKKKKIGFAELETGVRRELAKEGK
jgi:SpoVK/Ycf46/Vps4 family AAA+-type ATPase